MDERKVLVRVNQSNLTSDAEIEVPGLGLFQNGVPREVTDDQMMTFVAFHPELQVVTNPADLVPEGDEAVVTTRTGLMLWSVFKDALHIDVYEEAPEKAKAAIKSSAPVGKKSMGVKEEA